MRLHCLDLYIVALYIIYECTGICLSWAKKVSGQMCSKGVEVDFASLNAETLWTIFESKACYGGALAYAVLSRARKLGCQCSVSLERFKEARTKQKKDWLEWCSKFCNIAWARNVAFQVVSERCSYKQRLNACWSVRAPYSCPAISSTEFKLPHHAVARIAALAVHADTSDLLDQVVFCASDERRDIIPYLWSKLNENFICSKSWAPSFQFTFSDEVQLISPSASQDDDIHPVLIAETWCRILLHIGPIFSSSYRHSDQQTVWNQCVCDHKFQIPVHERVITMWIWLLWSSNPLPFFLNEKLSVPLLVASNRPPLVAGSSDPPCSPSSVERRLMVLQSLRSKRMVTKTEFMNKRQCILSSL